MSAPINSQREKIKKYFNLLVEEFITDSKHNQNIEIVFQEHLESSKKNWKTGGRTQRRWLRTGGTWHWKEVNGKEVPGSRWQKPFKYSYFYTITFLNKYDNEEELRVATVHEFTHLYLYATIGKHDHDDHFYSTMERLENWLNKNQGLKPRADKSHDRDQYGKDTDFNDNDEENTCPECSYPSPHHFPYCSHNKNDSRPTKNTITPQKAAEFNLLKKLIKNSKDLATLEKNYQNVKGNSLYSSSEVFSKNDKDGNSIKSRLDNLYEAQKWYLQSHSNEQPTNNSNSSLKGNESGAGSIFWLCLAGGAIILVGIVAYLALSEPNYKPKKKKKKNKIIYLNDSRIIV